MTTASPKTTLGWFSWHSKTKPLRVLVIGAAGVGKTAMVVRFITKRFIGDYIPDTYNVYTFYTAVDNEFAQFDILDAAGETILKDPDTMDAFIRWAEAFIIVYSVSERNSYEEGIRLQFLIHHTKRKRWSYPRLQESSVDVPMVFVGNKIDQIGERMVSTQEGLWQARFGSCVCFHEISVRESTEQVTRVFRDACRFWRVLNRYPKLRRSTSDVQDLHSEVSLISSHTSDLRQEKRRSITIIGRTRTKEEPEETDESKSSCTPLQKPDIEEPFRGRASTDGSLLSRPRRWRYAPPGSLIPHMTRVDRRMSISTRGSNASC